VILAPLLVDGSFIHAMIPSKVTADVGPLQ